MNYFKELDSLGHKLFDPTDYNFKLNVFADASNGYITEPFSSSKKKQVVVGAKDLFKDMLVGRNDSRKFTTGLICLYHEHTHFEQFGDIDHGFADPDVAYSFMARQNNDALYFLNYKNMVHELEAEHNGIMKAYRYIKENHPELNADECIKEHIRYKLNIGDTRYRQRCFGDSMNPVVVDFSGCNNIKDVDDMFKCLRDNVNESDLDSVSMMRSYNSARSDGEHNLLFDMFDENRETIDIFKSLPGSQEQLKFISSYLAEKCPDRAGYFKNYSVVSYNDYLQAYDEIKRDNMHLSLTKRGELLAGSLANKVSKSSSISRSDVYGSDDKISIAASFDDIENDTPYEFGI